MQAENALTPDGGGWGVVTRRIYMLGSFALRLSHGTRDGLALEVAETQAALASSQFNAWRPIQTQAVPGYKTMTIEEKLAYMDAERQRGISWPERLG